MFNNLSEIIMSIISGGSLIGAISSLIMTLFNNRKIQIKSGSGERKIEIDGASSEEILKLLADLKGDSGDPLDSKSGGNKPPEDKFNHFIKYLGIQKRYYDTNLAQTRAVFYIGITLLFVGIAMISIGVIMGLTSTKPDALTLILTFSSGVLIDFIGTIFVAMHTKTLETAAAYQQSISRVSNALLAKSIVDSLDDASLREQALIEIVKGLSQEK